MEEEFEEIQPQENAERIYKNRPNFLEDMDEDNFRKSDNVVNLFFQRNFALSPETKLLLALRFYASGSFLITVADFCGLSISSAGRAVKDVSQAIASLSSEFIKFDAMQKNINEFYKTAKFPKVIGAIDCTHVRIQSPGGDNAELYRNRKGYFSINVQAVCNNELIFQDIVARWPGSSHDSTIFNNSRLKFRLENKEFKNTYILGDSGYKVCDYMMTPLLNPITNCEKLYNESQIRTRNVVERCFGVWKRRFPVLSIGMRIAVNTAMTVIVACAVLHNISTQRKEPLPLEEQPDIINEIIENDNEVHENANNRNSNARTVLINSYFAR
ncbi:putative nuclease HARBI1 [Lucilia cuprina]|uniref:putative nuclease HARBI1 n=1 Tax=Lucilia cuprina TaxID=7375 RepID=UPI001F061239|nr:putative nuclease HARBI1 [Lucilia cuprina]